MCVMTLRMSNKLLVAIKKRVSEPLPVRLLNQFSKKIKTVKARYLKFRMQLVNIITQFCAKFQVVPVTESQVFGAKSARKNRIFRFFMFSSYHSATNRQIALLFCMQLGINMIKTYVKVRADRITKNTYYRYLKCSRKPVYKSANT